MEPTPNALEPPPGQDLPSTKLRAWKRAALCSGRIPLIRQLPLPVVGIIISIGLVNIVVWVVVGIILYFHRALASTALLAYVLGLRHALDADHISVGVKFQPSSSFNQLISLQGNRFNDPEASSGRATSHHGRNVLLSGAFNVCITISIVIITSIVVAATAATVRDDFDRYGRIGGIIGSSVSAGFLVVLGIMNMFILYRLVKHLKKLLDTHPDEQREEFKITGAGCLLVLLGKMFKLIDRPWKMYPLGVMFGLGFDTSSEVALLGISSIQASKGTSIWLILIFPILFTAGMALVDTTDGALMMTLYTSTELARDQIAVLYYSIVLAIITIIVAVVIGVVQLLSLILNVFEPKGRFWDIVALVEDYYDVIGAVICASFVVFGGLSILLYRPWRRWAERKWGVSERSVEAGIEEAAEEDPLLAVEDSRLL